MGYRAQSWAEVTIRKEQNRGPGRDWGLEMRESELGEDIFLSSLPSVL